MLSIQTPRELLAAMQKLQKEVLADADQLFAVWQGFVSRKAYEASAQNLACYLALRRHELPPLQLALMRWGLSSLGRSESRVRVTLDAVIATLGAICGLDASTLPLYPAEHAVFSGSETLEREASLMFGSVDSKRRTRILVTLPSEAAEDLVWMRELVQSGADCVRINCAHDNADAWRGMLRNLRLAERELECREPIRVLMDLGGPKVRTARPPKEEEERYHVGNKLLLTTVSNLEHASKHQRKHHGGGGFPVVGCTLAEPLEQLQVGEAVYIDDGQIGARALERVADGVVIEVVRAPLKGHKIRSDKGLNFPDTEFQVASLTEKRSR